MVKASLSIIQRVDDMFLFFNCPHSILKKLREKITKLQAPREDDGQAFEAQIIGNQLDQFLRRCLIASGQMMFEDVSTLFVQYQKYLQGLPYTFLHSTWQLENWVEHRAGTIEDDSMIKTWAQLDAEFIRDTGGVVSRSKEEESEGQKKFNH